MIQINRIQLLFMRSVQAMEKLSTRTAPQCKFTRKIRFVSSVCLPQQHKRQLCYGNVLHKSNKRTSREDETDSENDDDSEFKDERDSKIVRANVNSLRADLLLKSGLGMARNKIEVIFYDSKIRVNGQKLQKKSVQLNIGDEIDVIKGFSQANPSHLVIARVVILSTNDRSEGVSVILRRYKSMIIENYSGLNVYKSSAVPIK